MNKNEKNKFSKEKIINKVDLQKIKKNIIISTDNKLHISIVSIKIQNSDYKRNNKINKFENLKYYNLSLKIVNNKFIFENNNKDKIKIYNYIKKNISSKLNLKKENEKSRQSFNNIYFSKLIKNSNINKKKGNDNEIYNDKTKLQDYNKIIQNSQNDKYLKGCINFMIRAIKNIIYNIFIKLKIYLKYYQLKNIINIINNKKIKKYYFILLKKASEKKNYKNDTIKNNKKIIFNTKTKRYELINI